MKTKARARTERPLELLSRQSISCVLARLLTHSTNSNRSLRYLKQLDTMSACRVRLCALFPGRPASLLTYTYTLITKKQQM